jgi:hypothetical protein
MENQPLLFGLPTNDKPGKEDPNILAENANKSNGLVESTRIAGHSIFELGYALFRGDLDARSLKLLILHRMIEGVGSAVANDGEMHEMSLFEIIQLIPELPVEIASDAVHRMSQEGLLTCQGKIYQVAPLASVLIQFVRFVAHMQDESGASAAVISSVFSYQLEMGSKANPYSGSADFFSAIKAVILEVSRYNSHLENTIRHSVLADLDNIVKDLSAVNYFCGILDGLVNQVGQDSIPGSVYWLERARRVIKRLRDLVDALQGTYSMRISRSLSGSGRLVTDEILERWLVHALMNEKSTIVEWTGKLDSPPYLNVFPCWLIELISEEGPPVEIIEDNPNKKPLMSTVHFSDSEVIESPDDEQVMKIIREMKAIVLSKPGDSVLLSELIKPDDWMSSAIRLCQLSTALEIIERESHERWAVDTVDGTIHFPQGQKVESVSKAEIGRWTYLTQKKIAPAE